MPIISVLPYNLTNGTIADATQVMGDLNQIYNNVNTNAAERGANSTITSLSGLTTPLSASQGGTGGLLPIANGGTNSSAGYPIARAWLNYDYLGYSNTPTIVKGFNIASINRVSTGLVTVTLTTSMSDTSGVAILTQQGTLDGGVALWTGYTEWTSTSKINVYIGSGPSNTPADFGFGLVIFD